MQLRFLIPAHRFVEAWLNEDESRPIVAEIQRLLAGYGLYAGEAHGCYDAATAGAVSRFQELRGLKPTGRFDPVTYCQLLTPAATADIRPVAAVDRAAAFLPRAKIHITKSTRSLTLYDGNTALRQYPVAIGKPSTPTPEGNYAIATKILNPGGILGSRWMGLNFDAYGIHGTTAPWKIGQMVSNGCIRMHNANVEELFHLVAVGCPVIIRN
ncbi:L,D-transpeptidase family protein [Anaeroselena agilis]|uniref:L,D-transpeptidase family protein n=1 Tax=Anaeroselena agilis TaxID=3063788 RepID=A0ABU3P4X8_9FIRM|nr:L,D-transpeptidase family protein [Selenomonadales bacterium 4137-cl]